MNSPFELQIDFKNNSNWIYILFVEFEIPKHVWLHRRHGKCGKNNPINLHNNNLFSKRYIIDNEIVMENYKYCFNSFSLSPSINTGNMSDRTQKIWDLSFHSCNNDIRFVSTRTRTCGLGLLWPWMVHETFACMACW